MKFGAFIVFLRHFADLVTDGSTQEAMNIFSLKDELRALAKFESRFNHSRVNSVKVQ